MDNSTQRKLHVGLGLRLCAFAHVCMASGQRHAPQVLEYAAILTEGLLTAAERARAAFSTSSAQLVIDDGGAPAGSMQGGDMSARDT